MWRRFFLCLCLASPAGNAVAQAQLQPGVALKGYDVIAYVTVGKPTQGNPAISQVWDGARYLFVNEEHRRLFAADPDKYAPQFNGHCAALLARGVKIEADPENWVLSDGRLFLFAAPVRRDMLLNDPSIVPRARDNWARLK